MYHLYALAAISCFVSYFIIDWIITKIGDWRFAKAHGCKPPYRIPQSERIVGYGLFKKVLASSKTRTILQDGQARYTENGTTWKSTVLGRTNIHTTDPENIKAILATNFKDFGLGRRQKIFGPLLGKGIFTTDGSHWEHSRALVRPNFSRSQVADLDAFETHIQRLISQIPRDNSTVDLQVLFFRLTFDSATEFLFGESVCSLQALAGSEQQLFATAFDYAQGGLATRLRLGPLKFLYRDPVFDQSCKRVHAFVDKFVYRALEMRRSQDAEEKMIDDQNPERYVFLNELAKATRDPRQLRDELLNILLAGRDTTASLLSMTFRILAARPDVWSKLKAEVDELQGKKPDYEQLRNMKYLKYILNESLRLWPVVPGNARFANKRTTIPHGGGPDGLSPVFVAKDQNVNYSVFTMHRRHDLYGPDADEFKPERWETLRLGWQYLPFNGGPRICVGQQFALTEASYTIVRIVQHFGAIEDRDGGPWREQLGLTLASFNGAMVALTPR